MSTLVGRVETNPRGTVCVDVAAGVDLESDTPKPSQEAIAAASRISDGTIERERVGGPRNATRSQKDECLVAVLED